MIIFGKSAIKKIFCLGLALFILCSLIYKSHSALYIKKDEALMIALEDAGLSSSEIFDAEVDFERVRNQAWYEIEFESSSGEHEYTLDARNGEIIFSI